MTEKHGFECISALVHCRSAKDIVDAVRHGNLCFAPGKLKELSKLLPDDLEVN